MQLLTEADKVLGQCEVCRSFDTASHVPVAGTSTAFIIDEKTQVDPLFLDDILALRAMDVFAKCSGRPNCPREAEIVDTREAELSPGSSGIGAIRLVRAVSGLTECGLICVRDPGPELRAHPWIFERRNGLATGICNSNSLAS